MKPMKEMVEAVRDWVNAKIELLDPDTILRKTGDASKVTTIFTRHLSPTIPPKLPESGEKLDITMGKILDNLMELKLVAFTGSYKDLSKRAIRLINCISNNSYNAAYTEEILYGEDDSVFKKMWLIVGIGSSDTSTKTGATDFARAYLVVPKYEAIPGTDNKGRSYICLQLGSSGETARYTLKATAATGPRDDKLTLTIPKGSYAHVNVYELNGWDIG